MDNSKIVITGSGGGGGGTNTMAIAREMINKNFEGTMNKDMNNNTLDAIESISTMLNNSFGIMPYGSYGNYQTEREKRDAKNSQRSVGAKAFKKKKAKNKMTQNSKKKNRK